MRGTRLVIEERFHGPRNSGNGGYVCGRLAEFIEGSARVRLVVPPPLNVEMEVRRSSSGVTLMNGETLVAQAWPSADLDLEVPRPPSREAAAEASRGFSGFRSHRFPSCFVCGPERAAGDGLRIFAGPLPSTRVVACTWTPAAWLGANGDQVAPEFMWAVLDCPGGFAFPHPSHGTILLGELTATIRAPARLGETHVVIGWEIATEGRKHHTGTAIFSDAAGCIGVGRGTWLEVPDIE